MSYNLHLTPFFRSFRSYAISPKCNSTLSLSPPLSLLPPLWRCRPESPSSTEQTALGIRQVPKCPLDSVGLWEAAREGQSGTLVSPVKSSSSFLAVATIIAAMARPWCVVAALGVPPHLQGKLSEWISFDWVELILFFGRVNWESVRVL